MDGLLLVMGAAWLWTCLQAVPLPWAIAHALDLESVESATRLRGLSWGNAVPFTVSYDPGSTHLQILIGIGILSSFIAARLGGPPGLRPIAVATVVSSTLIGLVGFAHEATGKDVLFGVYTPRFTSTRLLAPLMNSNHLAGFCLMGALIAAGLASQELRRARAVWLAASAFCTTVVAWTLSRGAIAALLFGFVILAAWFATRKRSQTRRAAIPVAVVGATIAGIAAFASLEPIARRFETRDFDKIEAAVHGLRLLEGSTWWLGVGRGAFSSAFVGYQGSLDRYTHPENLIVQWTTEWGVPVAIALLLVISIMLWRRFRAAEEPLVAAVCVAVFALSLQNLVDFSLEMAGVAVVVAGLLGALLPTRARRGARQRRAVLVASLGVFATLLVVLSPSVLGSDTQSIVDRLTQYAKADDEARFVSDFRRGLALHPAEPALALLAGSYGGSKRHPSAARWLSIAMDQAPGWAAPHVVAARLLFAEGRTDQALLEIREAEQRQPGSSRELLCGFLIRFPKMEYIERAAPKGDQRVPYLNRVASACLRLPPELRAQLDRLILKEKPTEPLPVLRESQRLIALHRSDLATSLLERALEEHARDGRLWMALIDVHLSSGEPEQALAVLERAERIGIATESLLELRARVDAALGSVDAMRSSVIRLRGEARGDPKLVARSFMLQGELEAAMGNVDEALAAYMAADAADPEMPALQRAADLALRSGRSTRARRFYQTICQRAPEGPACARESQIAKELREPTAGPPLP
jgi:hypothetical protein